MSVWGIALALCLVACGSGPVGEPSVAPTNRPSVSPSGDPIELAGYGGGVMTCRGEWVEGWLRADVELHDRLLNLDFRAPTAIEIEPLATGAWPEPSGLGYPLRFVQVRWPAENVGEGLAWHSGVRLASGEVAVLNASGDLVAVTGGRYRLRGDWAMVAAIGGPWFAKGPWIDAFNVCLDSGSVVPQ